MLLRIPAYVFVSCAWGGVLNGYTSANYHGPLICAYLKKYEQFAKEDMFDIKDEKREWFNIDTSDYLNYNFDDLHHAHAHHGPQPDDMVLNNSWLVEMDKYLKGEPNKLKEHKNYLNYNFTYSDNGKWPTEEDIVNTFTKPGTDQKTPESLKKKE